MKGTKPKLKSDRKAIRKVPKPPEWLSEDAADEWRRVMPLMVERRILTDADMGTFENYVIVLGQVRKLDRLINKYGMFLKDARAGMKINPMVRLQSDAMTRAHRLAAELGLTPVSRSRPAIRDMDDGDDSDTNPLNIN